MSIKQHKKRIEARNTMSAYAVQSILAALLVCTMYVIMMISYKHHINHWGVTSLLLVIGEPGCLYGVIKIMTDIRIPQKF